MKKVLLLSALSSLLFLGATSVWADDFKLAVVDVPMIFEKTHQLQVIKEKIEKQFKPRESELVQVEHNLQTEASNFKKNEVVMKESERKKLKDKIEASRNKFRSMLISFNKDVAETQKKLFQSFTKQLSRVVAELAKKLRLDLVVPKDNILYAKKGLGKSLDISQQVLEALNK